MSHSSSDCEMFYDACDQLTSDAGPGEICDKNEIKGVICAIDFLFYYMYLWKEPQVKCGGLWQFLHREWSKLMTDYDEIFPIQWSDFTKSLYFRNNSKKKCKIRILRTLIFSPRNSFLQIKKSNFTRVTPVLGGISLALRGSGAPGATFGAPSAPNRHPKFGEPLTGRRRFYKLPLGHEDSKNALSFEIGQRETGFYSERTKSQTEWQSHPVAYWYIDSRNTRLRRDFSHPPGERRLGLLRCPF